MTNSVLSFPLRDVGLSKTCSSFDIATSMSAGNRISLRSKLTLYFLAYLRRRDIIGKELTVLRKFLAAISLPAAAELGHGRQRYYSYVEELCYRSKNKIIIHTNTSVAVAGCSVAVHISFLVSSNYPNNAAAARAGRGSKEVTTTVSKEGVLLRRS